MGKLIRLKEIQIVYVLGVANRIFSDISRPNVY